MKTMNQKQLRSVTSGMPDVNEQSEKIESVLFIGFLMIVLCLVLYAAIGAFGCWLYQYNHQVFIWLSGGTIGALIALVLVLFIKRITRLSKKEMCRRIKLPKHMVPVDKEIESWIGKQVEKENNIGIGA